MVLNVSVEDEKSVVVIEKAAGEIAKEKASQDLGGNHVKVAGVSAAPVTMGELPEGMSATEGAEEVEEEVEEMTAVRDSVIPRIKHMAMRRGGDRISCWQMGC